MPPAQQARRRTTRGCRRDVDGYVAAGFVLNTLGFVNAVPAVKGNLANKVVGGILSSNLEVIGSQANRFAGSSTA